MYGMNMPMQMAGMPQMQQPHMPMQMAGMPQMQQPQMQQQMMGMPQMHQPQMQQPQTQQPLVAMLPPSVQQETQAVYSSVPGWRPGMETKVTTAGWPLFKLPKVRLTESIEFVESELDVTLLAGRSTQCLIIILWELTRVRPETRIQDLRCSLYIEIYMRLRRAAERHKETSGQMLKAYVQFIKDYETSL